MRLLPNRRHAPAAPRVIAVPPAREAGLPMYHKRPVLSEPEADFRTRALAAYGERFVILCNVSLYSLIAPTEATKDLNPARQATMRQMHVDCVFVDPKTRLPILAIELDDSTHLEPDAFNRDGRKDLALETAGIKVLRLKYMRERWSWRSNWTLAKARIDAKLQEAGA